MAVTVTSVLADHLTVRARWSGDYSPTDTAWESGRELADSLDTALRKAAEPWAERIAVAAVGGYGRSELTVHSDVDLVILHDGMLPEEGVRQILYALWDAGIRVGHATLTPSEAVGLARDRLESLCSFLTMRVVTGREDLAQELTGRMARLLRRDRSNLETVLAEEEHSLWGREPFWRQDGDLKSGRGGLRSLHRLDWDRRRAELLGRDPPLAPTTEEKAARRILLSVRAALHAVRGKAADQYALDLREPVGRWLGTDAVTVARSVYLAARRIDTLTSLRWGRVRTSQADPIESVGRAALYRLRARWSAATPAADPALEAARKATSNFDGHLSPSDLTLASRPADAVWTEADRKALVEVLAAGEAGWRSISTLWEAGWVDDALPELSHLAGLPQIAPFHSHPVDAHLGRTVAEVVEIASGRDAWLGGLCEAIGSLDELLLAAWLHDAGKGLGGDHSRRGAQLAQSLLGRLGFSPATGHMVSRAVDLHLLLQQQSIRSDPDDPRVVSTVARKVGDSHMLLTLTVLAAADARATGPDAWNPWHRDLLRRLVDRVRAELTGSTPAGLEREWSRRVGVALASTTGAEQVEAHLAGMPPEYLLTMGPDLAAEHIRLVTPPPPEGEMKVAVIPSNTASTVLVASRDRPGLLATIAGVLSLHNISVLEARVTTRSDGVAIDTFRVADALAGNGIDGARWESVRRDLATAGSGGLDLGERLRVKEAAYQTSTNLPSSADLWQEHDRVLLEVRAADRLGLLYAVTACLARHGLGIRLAKIETRGGQAIDVFTLDRPPIPTDREELLTSVRRAAFAEI